MTETRVLRVWRVERAVRRLAVGVSLFFIVVAMGGTTGLTPGFVVVIWAVAILVLLTVWGWYLVPYIALTPERVVVRGVFSERSLDYRSIEEVRPGLLGVRIETADQGSVTAWAVQKSKFSEWSHRHTRADDVVAEIMDRVHAVDAVPASPAG